MPADKKKTGYEEINSGKVIEAVSQGFEVIACNLATKVIISCDDLKIGALRSFIANDAVVFFKKLSADE